MSLFLARSFSTSNYNFAEAQADVISISNMDSGIGFDEANPSTIEGAICVEVTYARTEAGPTAIRLEALVNDTGFTNPRRIIIIGVPSGTLTPAGIDISIIAGQAWDIGEPDSPFANNICTMYDTGQCSGNGHWVDRDGGGTVGFPPDVILYHELAHCFHFATGVATTEPLATDDENDMRDVRNLDHRNRNSHNGGCGGGPISCCIIASLATGSPYSQEINKLRNIREFLLRRSRVGDEFFNELHYRYYDFSPEVTLLMGRQPKLSPIIRKYFVLPLLSGLELLVYYVENRGEELSEHLRTELNCEGLTEIYRKKFLSELSFYLDMIRNYNSKTFSRELGDLDKDNSGFSELLGFINIQTIKDEYIDWALLKVVEIWTRSALLLYSGKSDTDIDIEIKELIDEWICMMPISEIWEEFSRLETEMELQSIEKFFFTTGLKNRFGMRLIEKHSKYRDTIYSWTEQERS